MTTKEPDTPASIREFAHELRAPLGGMEAMLDLLAESVLESGQRRLVEGLTAALAHLRQLASGILAGPDARSAGDAPVPERLVDLVAALRPSIEARAARRGLAAILDIAPAVEAVRVEAGPLRQVIENLIDNAIRLADSGEVRLSIDARPGERFAVTVTDTGPGLTAADAARLIRDGGGIKGRAGGAGIGLSIAGRLVAERGGRLSGGPGPGGKGAAFAFDWPIQPLPVAGGVLIVDDHPASRLVLRTILHSAGIPCAEAASPGAALTAIASQRPVIVMTDLTMPEGGGAALIEAIRCMPAKAQPHVIVVSADPVSGSDPVAGLIDGALRKPITVRGVLDTVAPFLRREPSHAA